MRLTKNIILAAQEGNVFDMEFIVNYYGRFISHLSTIDSHTADGLLFSYIDETIRMELEQKLRELVIVFDKEKKHS